MERNYTVWQWGLCYYRASVTFKRVTWLVAWTSFHPAVLSPVPCLVAHFKTNLPCHQLWKLQCVLAEQTVPPRHPWHWPPFQQVRTVTCPRGTVLLIHLPPNRCTTYLFEMHLLLRDWKLSTYLFYLWSVQPWMKTVACSRYEHVNPSEGQHTTKNVPLLGV